MSIPKYTVELSWLGDDSVVIEVDASNLSNVEWCKYSDVKELEQEIARLKEKLRALADEASRCRESVYREGRFSDHERLSNAIKAAREEEEG